MKYEDINNEDLSRYWRGAILWHSEIEAPYTLLDTAGSKVYLAPYGQRSYNDEDILCISNEEFFAEKPIDKFLPRLGYRNVENFCVFYSCMAGRGMQKGLNVRTLSKYIPNNVTVRFAEGELNSICNKAKNIIEIFRPTYVELKAVIDDLEAKKRLGAALNEDLAVYVTTKCKGRIYFSYKSHRVGHMNTSNNSLSLKKEYAWLEPVIKGDLKL